MTGGVQLPDIVVIRKIKRPEGIGRWPTYVMEGDRHGIWLFSPKGTIYRGQTRNRVGENEVGRGNRASGQHVMHLIPKSGWWIAVWCRQYGDSISVDVCRPPSLVDSEWCYIDLELDPMLWPDGQVVIDDEDEFAVACEAGIISENEAAEARAASRSVAHKLRTKDEPFGSMGWRKLDAAVALDLPPIRELRHITI